jgi:MFS transporter, ACS family, hexuronate transporter
MNDTHNNTQHQKENRLGLMLFVLTLPGLVLSLNQNGFLGLMPFVQDEFELTRTQVGTYSTFFFISSATLAVFTGRVVDRLGPKKSLFIGITCMSLIMIAYGWVPSYAVLLVMAILAGTGQSIIMPSINTGVILAVPQNKRASSMGITQSGFGVGGIIGASLLPVLGQHLGWRISVQIAAGAALLTGFVIQALYREHAFRNTSDSPDASSGQASAATFNIQSLLTNGSLIRMLFSGFIFGFALSAVTSHFTVFLSGDMNMTPTQAGIGFSVLHLGGIITRPLWGLLSDRLFRLRRRISLFIISVIMGSMYLLMAFVSNMPSPAWAIVFLSAFLLGCSAFGWQAVYFVMVGESTHPDQVGLASGVSLLFVRVGMLTAPPIFGVIADKGGSYTSSWLIFGIVIIAVSFQFLIRDGH